MKRKSKGSYSFSLNSCIALLLSLLISIAPITDAWMHSPLDRHGWILFSIWIGAFFFLPLTRSPNPLPGYISLALSFGSVIADIYALRYLAFTSALIGFKGFNLSKCGWAVSGTAWMPLSTWFFAKYAGQHIIFMKWALLSVGLGFSLYAFLKNRKPSHKLDK
jgi:hypothetical protein